MQWPMHQTPARESHARPHAHEMHPAPCILLLALSALIMPPPASCSLHPAPCFVDQRCSLLPACMQQDAGGEAAASRRWLAAAALKFKSRASARAWRVFFQLLFGVQTLATRAL